MNKLTKIERFFQKTPLGKDIMLLGKLHKNYNFATTKCINISKKRENADFVNHCFRRI